MANFLEENFIEENPDSMSKIVLVVMSDVDAIVRTLLHDSFMDIWSKEPINIMIYIGDDDKEFKNSKSNNEKAKKVKQIKETLKKQGCHDIFFATYKWANNTNYEIGDIVWCDEQKYKCLKKHKSKKKFKPSTDNNEGDFAYWDIAEEIKRIYDIFDGNSPANFFINEQQKKGAFQEKHKYFQDRRTFIFCTWVAATSSLVPTIMDASDNSLKTLLRFDFVIMDKTNITKREKSYIRDNRETTYSNNGNFNKKRKLNNNSSSRKNVRKNKILLPFKEFSPKNIVEVVECSIKSLCVMVNDANSLDIDDHTFINNSYYGEESDADSDSDESYSGPDRSGGNGNTEKYQDWLNRVANKSMEDYEKDLRILLDSETNPGEIPKELSIAPTVPDFAGALVTSADALLAKITTNTTVITTGTQTGLATTSSGSGSGAILTVVASGTTVVTGVTVTTTGSGYAVGDTLTVAAANIDGSDADLVFTLEAADIPYKKSVPDLIKNSKKQEQIEKRKLEIKTYCEEVHKYVKIGQAIYDEMSNLLTQKAIKEQRILNPKEFTFYSYFNNNFDMFEEFVNGKKNIIERLQIEKITTKQLWDKGKNMLQRLLGFKSSGMYCIQKARNELLNCCGFETPGYWYKGSVKRIGQ